MDSFLIPSGQFQCEIAIKRSRFIAVCGPVDGREAARTFIAEAAKKHADASHHCWAMVAGTPWDVYQQDQSDDGEPRGTAGKPMLNVLQHAGIGHIAVVVTRFYGGTKLGVGGLVRAYSQSVVDLLAITRTTVVFARVPYRIVLQYSYLASAERYLSSHNCEITNKSFTDAVELTVHVPISEQKALAEHMNTLGRGTILMDKLE